MQNSPLTFQLPLLVSLCTGQEDRQLLCPADNPDWDPLSCWESNFFLHKPLNTCAESLPLKSQPFAFCTARWVIP